MLLQKGSMFEKRRYKEKHFHFFYILDLFYYTVYIFYKRFNKNNFIVATFAQMSDVAHAPFVYEV